MKYINLSILFLATSIIFSCSTKLNLNQAQYFGQKISPKNPISVGQMTQRLKTEAEFQSQLKGTVQSVCQVKGCWINITSTDSESEVFVKFKDYSFFLPKDISGQQVILQGIAYKEVTPVDELKHYAEDEGATPEEIAKITEPVEEIKFLAEGVILLQKS